MKVEIGVTSLEVSDLVPGMVTIREGDWPGPTVEMHMSEAEAAAVDLAYRLARSGYDVVSLLNAALLFADRESEAA
jgi:hypothetical protein